MQERIDTLRSRIRAGATIGISGDYVAPRRSTPVATPGTACLEGFFRGACRAIVDAARASQAARVTELSHPFDPLWDLFREHGSYRAISALAEELGLVAHPNLPRPVLGLHDTSRDQVRAALRTPRDGGVPGLDMK